MAGSVVSDVNDGPVLNLMNKRLRALKKKYNRIIQMEEDASQGKTFNKEQKEVLLSKSAVVALIDEYEKLRQPLSVAVQEEVHNHEKAVEDLVKVLYLACHDLLHREKEDLDIISEKEDLDIISLLGDLFISSEPVQSHKNALEKFMYHTKLWLSSSGEAAVTYSRLKEKMNKILHSDHPTTAPIEMADLQDDSELPDATSAHQENQLDDTRGQEEMDVDGTGAQKDENKVPKYDFERQMDAQRTKREKYPKYDFEMQMDAQRAKREKQVDGTRAKNKVSKYDFERRMDVFNNLFAQKEVRKHDYERRMDVFDNFFCKQVDGTHGTHAQQEKNKVLENDSECNHAQQEENKVLENDSECKVQRQMDVFNNLFCKQVDGTHAQQENKVLENDSECKVQCSRKNSQNRRAGDCAGTHVPQEENKVLENDSECQNRRDVGGWTFHNGRSQKYEQPGGNY